MLVGLDVTNGVAVGFTVAAASVALGTLVPYVCATGSAANALVKIPL